MTRGRIALWALAGVLAVAAVLTVVLLVVGVGPEREVSALQLQSQQQIANLQRQVRSAELQIRLSALQAELQAEGSAAQVERPFEALLADLELLYADAQGQALDTWDALQPELGALAEQLREGSSDALRTLDGVLELLRADAPAGEAGP